MPSSAVDTRVRPQSRTERSRLAICEACLDIVQEGVLQPSADRIAERAGVSRRSVFNHFADLAELYDAVVEVGMKRCAPLLEEILPSEPIGRRVARLAEMRCNFLEATAQFTRALTAQALVGAASDQAIRVAREALQRQISEIERIFAADLRSLQPTERADVLEALGAAMAPLQWEYLRHSRDLPPKRARAVTERTLAAILRDAGIRV
jgi:AcrR family transcriptional regulator